MPEFEWQGFLMRWRVWLMALLPILILSAFCTFVHSFFYLKEGPPRNIPPLYLDEFPIKYEPPEPVQIPFALHFLASFNLQQLPDPDRLDDRLKERIHPAITI